MNGIDLLAILQKNLDQDVIFFYTRGLLEWCYTFYHCYAHSKIIENI